MLRLTRWCIAHRRVVLIGWVAIAILVSVAAQAVGRAATRATSRLPGTESQRALDLLAREFPPQSGDVDTFVFHVAHGTIDSPAVRAAMLPALAKLEHLPARRRRDQPRTARRAPSRSRATGGPRSRRSTTTSARTCCPTTPARRC